MRMQFATGPDPTDLLMLPWSTPLAEWPKEKLVSLPRGISRHVVRFVRIGGIVYAIKEISQGLAEHEYELLRELAKVGIPVVQAIGVVANRMTPGGRAAGRRPGHQAPAVLAALPGAVLPADGSATWRRSCWTRWPNCWCGCTWSASPGRTARCRTRCSGGTPAPWPRTWWTPRPARCGRTCPRGNALQDLDIVETNVAGELLDLQMSGLLPESVDPLETAISVLERYERLWDLLTAPQTMGEDEWWRIEQRLRKLNELGFDVAQIQINEKDGDPQVMVQTQVVDAGHHRRRLFSLTGIDVQENQARRILNDLDTYRSQAVMPQTEVDEDTVAHHYVTDVYDPVIEAIPRALAEKLEPAEVFHEVLEHRWFLSQAAGHEVSMEQATQSYLDTVLRLPAGREGVPGLDPDGRRRTGRGRHRGRRPARRGSTAVTGTGTGARPDRCSSSVRQPVTGSSRRGTGRSSPAQTCRTRSPVPGRCDENSGVPDCALVTATVDDGVVPRFNGEFGPDTTSRGQEIAPALIPCAASGHRLPHRATDATRSAEDSARRWQS